MEDWSAARYLRFEAERTRPAADLLGRVPGGARRRIADLGCGPGNSTELLAARYPDAAILGLDASDDMLAKARARLPNAQFQKRDIAQWSPGEAFDLIFANAVLQWVPRHIPLMAYLLSQLSPGGILAVQMPDNENEASHRLMREVALREPFRAKLAGAAAARETIGAFADYYQALAPRCAALDLWRTTYAHALAGPDAIVEWVSGAGLRPFLDPLSKSERALFLADYRGEIAAAYPPLEDGRVLLPFPRLFVVAVRGARA